MKRPTMLLERLLLEAEVQFKASVRGDVATIQRRFEKEGMSFLTITLPTFCDYLDRGLTDGCLTVSLPGFKPWKRGRVYPAFMQGMLRRVFSYADGRLLTNPCIESIRLMRQISRAFKKVLLECSTARIKRAFERYVENDRKVISVNQFPGSLRSVRTVSGYLWSDLEILSGELYCAPGRHGTGATAERHTANQRYDICQWPIRGEGSFPLSWFTSYREDDHETFAGITLLDESEEMPARVVTVPKTLKTPRIICVEPSYMMVRQQSVLTGLVKILESGRLGFKSIHFTNQNHNKNAALLGSIDGSLATIDLSDASDLVSNDLVKEIFRTCPTFLNLIQDCRTTSSRLPDGQLIQLKKFASMGSALCFPIEAMVFYTLILSAMVDLSGRRVSRKLLKDLTAKVLVYGDDIVVPTRYAVAVKERLEAFGLKVNNDKSFCHGFFRESCGGDYFLGHDVTPVYVRRWSFNSRILKPEDLASLTSLSNQLYKVGYWQASSLIRGIIDDRITRNPKGFIVPYASSEVNGVFHFSHWRDTGLRWSNVSHRYERRTFLFQCTRIRDRVTTLAGGISLSARRNNWTGSVDRVLDKCPRSERGYNSQTQIEGHRYSTGDWRRVLDPSPLTSSIDESVRPYALSLKRRWAPAQAGLW